MIRFFLYFNLLFIITFLLLLIKGKSPWLKVLSNRLMVTCIVIEIVLYAVWTGLEMVLDLAIVFAILGFVDVQFLSVYLRKKGDL